MTGLTTHVLDTALGKPAEGMTIDLFKIEAHGLVHIKAVVTNADGRVDGGPMLIGESFQKGQYELLFHAGAYLKKSGQVLADPPFLDMVPIRFGIADTTAHYHVPLLISPWSYSTYRGS